MQQSFSVNEKYSDIKKGENLLFNQPQRVGKSLTFCNAEPVEREVRGEIKSFCIHTYRIVV